ncbi:hydrolase, alpha/beta domain protein [Teladorsagia circumcincta]|uniref:Hydrolase, alpha/beta domain protein n=1 Tax=Teladorsagia circumcincta TaxID=45464 RepID=A0A2G9UVT7_TELCI|nr:hydrolase, alpha/beta domain protein [Teladorsagia circumcincta]
MLDRLLVLVLVAFTVQAKKHEDPECTMTTPQIIEHWGYPAEIHTVTTEDGYILELHRIPYGRNGFLFADAGFDVWLGNMRGNTYSTKHVSLSPKHDKFWEWTWDEMAKYDLQSMVDLALSTTGQKDLYYIGHSQGTLTMFSKLSMDPDFSSKIRKFFALAPVGAVSHIKGMLRFLANDFSLELDAYFDVFGAGKFLPNGWIMKVIADSVCADTSSMNVMHWLQMVKKGTVAMYDYGTRENKKKYGQSEPPEYDFTKIQNPIYVYSGDEDWLADPEDVSGYLMPRISHTVVQNTVLHDYNHLDFIWGLRAAADIYEPIIDIVKKDLK